MKLCNKRILGLFLSLAIIFGMLFAPIQSVFAEETELEKLTIVHVNDVHGRIEEDDYDGMGFAKMMTKVKELKEENPNLVLLNAGDTIHGLPIVTVSQGEIMIELMNAMGFDAMVPGNHDFNYGYDRLIELKDIAEFPMIAANIKKEDGTEDFLPYIVLEKGGIKVGIFGLATPETKYKANPKNTEGVNFLDPIESAKTSVRKLQEEDVDIIIALAHIGVADDADPCSLDIAENVEGIDLLVDGHSHTLYPEGKLVNNTLIVQAEDYVKNIGIVNIEFKDKEIVKKEASIFTKEEAKEIAADEEIEKLIEEIKTSNKEITDVVIGKTKVRLDGDREIVRTQESNIGNLLADALINLTKADAVILNGGDIRTPIDIGEITKEDILIMLPFGSYGVVLELEGKDILLALENGLSVYPDTFGGFPQVAGMSFKVDKNKEAGSRIHDLKIQGKPIDLGKKYKLATNDFLAVGGDKYESLLNGKLLGEYEALEEILMDYIEEIGEIDIQTEGRIVYEEMTDELEESIKGEEYIIKPNDVLWKIAEKFGIAWEELSSHNKLDNPHLIFPGQKLLVPIK